MSSPDEYYRLDKYADEEIRLKREWLPPEADLTERILWYSKRLKLFDYVYTKASDFYESTKNNRN